MEKKIKLETFKTQKFSREELKQKFSKEQLKNVKGGVNCPAGEPTQVCAGGDLVGYCNGHPWLSCDA